MPGTLLQEGLVSVAASFGPLPQPSLRIADGRDGPRPADRPKKQRGRPLNAECETEGCGYNVRVVAKWVRELGKPAARCMMQCAAMCRPGDDEVDEIEVAAEDLQREPESV